MENQKDNQNDLQKLDITIEPPKNKTGHCEKHGDYPLKEFRNPYTGDTKFLGSCQKCKDEADAEKLLINTERLIKTQKKYSGLPERFENYTFDDFKIEGNLNREKVIKILKQYVEEFDSNKINGRSIVIIGPPGTGKTMAAACIINSIIDKTYCTYENDEYTGEKRLIEHDSFAKYCIEYNFTREIKDTWSDKTKSESDAIEYYCKPALLIFDEIGVSFGSEADKILLYQVINGRYEKLLPTILMSNLNLQDLTKHCGERIMDRMKENNGINLLFNWGSYRK